MISRIVPSGKEHTLAALESGTIEHGSQSFRRDGALIIKDILDVAVVAETRRQFSETYSQYLNGGQHEDVLDVGYRRLMITVDFTPPFDDAQLFANPYILPILSAALGEDFVIGAYGVVCSLPSAPHSIVIATVEFCFHSQALIGYYLRQPSP
jgi:hypothetical protein